MDSGDERENWIGLCARQKTIDRVEWSNIWLKNRTRKALENEESNSARIIAQPRRDMEIVNSLDDTEC